MSEFNDPSRIDALKQIRGEITRVDEQILNLLSERRRLSHAVAATKDLNTAVIRDPSREEDLLVNLVQHGRQKGLDAHFVTKVFHEIIDDSVRIQQEYFQRALNQGEAPALRVAIQGIEGSYSSIAAHTYLSRRHEGHLLVECQRHKEVIEAVEQGRADLGILAIENTNTGAYGEVYDLLLQTNLHIVGEEKMEIRYCLLSPQLQPLGNIRKVYCHAQAAAQCSQFLSKLPDVIIENYPDSAVSVRKLNEEGISEYAAIASEEAANLYGLKVLSTQIANSSRIYTRYVVVAGKAQEVDLRIPCKTSIVMATHHQAGALLESLQVFRDYGINLAKLESRPIEGNPWEELFYVDFDGNLSDPSIQEALGKLATVTRFLKVLGCYPAGELSRTLPPRRRIHAGRAPGRTAEALAPQSPTKVVFQVHGHTIGGEQPTFVAGPDDFGSMSQFSRLARVARDSGVDLLRIGCSSAMGDMAMRTNVDEGDLQMAREIADGYGMGLLTELSSPHDIDVVGRYADVIQVGAWNMRNSPLLRELGRQTKPVLLYRNIASGIDEFMEAANWILQGGNRQVILCDAGVKRFDGSARTIVDPASLCELAESTQLPVMVDLRYAVKNRSHRLTMAAALRHLPIAGLILHTDWRHSVDEGSLQALSADLNDTIMALEGPHSN